MAALFKIRRFPHSRRLCWSTQIHPKVGLIAMIGYYCANEWFFRCTHCGHCSVTFDPFWDLSLPLPSGRSSGPLRLSHCLEAFTKEETLDGDEKPKCAKCNERRRCTKSFSIQRFPQVSVCSSLPVQVSYNFLQLCWSSF